MDQSTYKEAWLCHRSRNHLENETLLIAATALFFFVFATKLSSMVLFLVNPSACFCHISSKTSPDATMRNYAFQREMHSRQTPVWTNDSSGGCERCHEAISFSLVLSLNDKLFSWSGFEARLIFEWSFKGQGMILTFGLLGLDVAPLLYVFEPTSSFEIDMLEL